MTLPKEVEEKLEAVLDEWLENFDVPANEAGDFFEGCRDRANA